MWKDTLKSMTISMITVFLVSLVLSGFDIASSLLVLVTISMILINLGGLMYWWDISLNAVSLVNLVMVSLWLVRGGFAACGAMQRFLEAESCLTLPDKKIIASPSSLA